MKRFGEIGGYGCHLGSALVVLVSALSLAAGPAQAQKNTAAKKPQSAWVKLCEDAKLKRRKKDGKVENVSKNICLTHHERLDGNTGLVIISAAIRRVQGQKEPSLMVMVPLGMALPPGIKAAVYNPQQWAKAQKKEKVNDKDLKPLSLKYSICHQAGCTAEIRVDESWVKNMKAGGGLMVLALNAQGSPVAFPIPLTGFTAAHDGKPVDNKAYSKARRDLMKRIRERLRQRVAEQRAKQKVPAAPKN